jgi:hypothetical protein
MKHPPTVVTQQDWIGPAFSTFREPDGQITWRTGDLPVQSLLQKYFCFSELQIRLYDSPSRPERGALRNVINVGRGCGGRG